MSHRTPNLISIHQVRIHRCSSPDLTYPVSTEPDERGGDNTIEILGIIDSLTDAEGIFASVFFKLRNYYSLFNSSG